MFPSFLPPEAKNLTEPTSINLAQQIQSHSIVTPLTGESIETSYVKQGEGNTPMLLLHGFDSSVLEFRRLLPLLSNNREVWAVDLLGFGFTARNPLIPYTPEAIKIHLYYFWKTLIKQPVILLGASMGGTTALDFALTYPQLIRKLVLLDSGGLTKPPPLGKLMFPPFDYLATEFLRNLRVRQSISRSAYYDKSFASKDALICAALHLKCPGWKEALISFTKNGGYGLFGDRLKEISQLTLIIWGENDQILGTKIAAEFVKEIPEGKLIWIKECGHLPHLEKPEITAEYILEWTNTC
jgi:pimeloyl-ACP methyl ester carboxylesterase